jgi:hypothetical protein
MKGNTGMNPMVTISDSKLTTDGANEIKFEDVSVFFESLNPRKSNDLMSSPTKKPETAITKRKLVDIRGSNIIDKTKTTNCQSDTLGRGTESDKGQDLDRRFESKVSVSSFL